MSISIKLRDILMKEKGRSQYYWGIGLENETYLQFEQGLVVDGAFVREKIGSERYSIDYRKCYLSGALEQVVPVAFEEDKKYSISKMVNSHTLDKLDVNLQHRTLTHTKPAVDNPEFSGKSIIETFIEGQPYNIQSLVTQKSNPMGAINFDGDSIEFVTKYFENRTIPQAFNELRATKELFLEKFNESGLFEEKLRFPLYNSGLNMFISNQENIVLFNNGTYHFHLTLPTLTENSRIVDYPAFEQKHFNAIYALQWFEPFFIATLGSPDIMGVIANDHQLELQFAGGSMRNAMSRYTGVGTFHKSMSKGKILTYSVEEFRKLLKFGKEDKIWWRDQIEADLGYQLLEDVGLDFNMEKMYQSGFEFRSFDEFPLHNVKDVLHAIVLVCERSLHVPNIPWGHDSEVWNQLVVKALKDGFKATLSKEEKIEVAGVFAVDLSNYPRLEKAESMEVFFFTLLELFHEMYQHENECVDAFCGQTMENAPTWDNFNRYQIEQHRIQMQAIK